MDAVVVREGKNLKGRALAVVLGSVGKSRLERTGAVPAGLGSPE